jgi:hypothetical protein
MQVFEAVGTALLYADPEPVKRGFYSDKFIIKIQNDDVDGHDADVFSSRGLGGLRIQRVI